MDGTARIVRISATARMAPATKRQESVTVTWDGKGRAALLVRKHQFTSLHNQARSKSQSSQLVTEFSVVQPHFCLGSML